MNKNIDYYFKKYDSVLPHQTCSEMIEYLDKLNLWEEHRYYQASLGVTYTHKDEPKNCAIDPKDNLSLFLNNAIEYFLTAYLRECSFKWWCSGSGRTEAKFIKYEVGTKMHPHCDHIHSIFDGEKKGVPILTAIFLLNDDFEGGNLILWEDKKIDMNAGDLVIFPSNFLYPHEIETVTKGTRYSIAFWAW